MANRLMRFLSDPMMFGRNGTKAGETSGVVLVDQRLPLEPGLSFFSPDGTRTIWRFGGGSDAEHVSVETAYCCAAYAFVAMRWRAARMMEAPLMVVKEDQKDGSDEWIPNHPLVPLIEQPSPDYDMGELLFRTSLSVDSDGHALWLKDANLRGRPGRLSLFRGSEFSIKSTRDRLRGEFVLKTSQGEKSVGPDDVVYFHEPDPNNWLKGLSRLEVFLAWLNLSQSARIAIRNLLKSSKWPSLVATPDATWNPTQAQLDEFKRQVQEHVASPQEGRPLVMLGGGKIEKVSNTVSDLIPGTLLNRVESICASVFGVPAIVLQYEVGLQNSPWSQMAEARRMAYEDTAEPMWKSYGDVITRQLLRPLDTDPTHFVRFDTSRVTALQADQQKDAQTAASLTDIASYNERRTVANLEPVNGDPEADKMPWVIAKERADQFQSRIDALTRGNTSSPTDTPPADEAAKLATIKRELKRDVWAALRAHEIQAAEFEWALTATRRFEHDREKIVALFDRDFGTKADEPSPEQRRKFFRSLKTYLEGDSSRQWKANADPLALAHAERASATVVADLGFRFDVVRPGIQAFAEKEVGFLIQAFAEKEVGFLIKNIQPTTRDAVEKAVSEGLQSGLSTRDIAKQLRDLPAFDRSRAMLVARTESARVMNGAPTEMLQERERVTGRKFTKTWSTALDDRVRDEHAAMEGETVGVGESFSNGLDFPSEPNCRCVVTYGEVEE